MNPDKPVVNQPIFITGRFRSGTSFMWQLFNQLDSYCAWYEPLHPQLLSAIKHVDPKQDHVGIDDYWQTYHLKPEFKATYSMQFATQKLYLEPADEYPELEAYIRQLIDLSKPDIPVLQFNRVDLRLSWLKAKFPEAKIIHIERNPLQLYHSQRKHIDEVHRDAAHYWDAYELMPWCYALQQQFPFLLSPDSKHAFYQFYTIYLLSKRMAVEYADVSINLDTQVFQSDEFINQLAGIIDLSAAQKAQIKSMTQVPDLPVFDAGLTNELAAIMTEVDLKLTAAGLMDEFGVVDLASIKSNHQPFWQGFDGATKSTTDLLLNINQLNSELTRILAENKRLKDQLDQLQANSMSVTEAMNDDSEESVGNTDE